MNFWVALPGVLTFISIVAAIWLLIVVTRVIFNVFLNIPIKAEPFRREEGILRYSVNLQTRDGVSIKGFFLPGKNTQGKTIIFCHEIGAGAASFQKYAYFLRERGFNIFTFDFRGHGLSGNSDGYIPRQWVTQYEVKDLTAVIRYLAKSNDVDPQRIGLFGISKGGGAALIAAARHSQIKAVVSDGAFSTAYTVIDYIEKWIPIYSPFHRFPYFVYWFLCHWTLFWVSQRLHCFFPALEKALPRLKNKAVFMIHGADDSFILSKQSKRLFDLIFCSKEHWIIPEARHNEGVRVAEDLYAQRISDFFNKHL